MATFSLAEPSPSSMYGLSSNTTSSSGSSVPSWMPTPDSSIRELMSEYDPSHRQSNADIAALQEAGNEQQGRILTTAMTSANNAAADYSNRARQAGGSGMGAGLVRAQAQTSAAATAGEAKVQQARDVLAARDKAASLASQIAYNIGNLRTGYLSTLASWDINNRQLANDTERLGLEKRRQSLLEESERNKNRSGSYQVDALGRVSNYHGNSLEDNSRFNPTTGFLSYGGGGR